MPSLGTWTRNDGTPQETASDGYATGFVLHVLQTAGVPKDDVKVAKGLPWLKRNQTATGAWRSLVGREEARPGQSLRQVHVGRGDRFCGTRAEPLNPLHARYTGKSDATSNFSEVTMNQTQWKYLEAHPGSSYKQLFIKGTRLRAEVIAGEMETASRTTR